MRLRLKVRCTLIRFADDAVMAFEDTLDAMRVRCVLDKRLARYGLTLHPDKTSPPRSHRTGSRTKLLPEPQPLPARVVSMTALVLRLPELTQAAIAALVTPLQLQTCMPAGISSIVTF